MRLWEILWIQLKTITFNMCHGEGLDGIIDVERQAKFLKKYKPDILFIQEIDMYTQRVYSENQEPVSSGADGELLSEGCGFYQKIQITSLV